MWANARADGEDVCDAGKEQREGGIKKKKKNRKKKQNKGTLSHQLRFFLPFRLDKSRMFDAKAMARFAEAENVRPIGRTMDVLEVSFAAIGESKQMARERGEGGLAGAIGAPEPL